jgi:hypothetical protein
LSRSPLPSIQQPAEWKSISRIFWRRIVSRRPHLSPPILSLWNS